MERQRERGFFTRVGRLAVEHPRKVLATAGVFFMLAGLAGNGLVHHLSTGGFDDTSSQATRAQRTLERVFHQGNPDVVLMVKARQGGVDDPAIAAEGRQLTEELATQPGVEQAASMLRYSLTVLDTNKPARLRLAHFAQFREGRLFSMRILVDSYELLGQAIYPPHARMVAVSA